ncbi:MAG: ligase-associated DNA damage response endonuclease PdeM [Rhodobacteraceae bacterium]|nr:ligase-associated DNA damage response endonuclease PdeM [Paracoccaceae bacterium]
MNAHSFTLAGAVLEARGSGALWWPERRVLVVSDLHLGKSERIAREGGAMLPPYETQDTLARLDGEVAAVGPAAVICLGDSFDDLAASEGLTVAVSDWLTRLMAGRQWIWIEGNHDPGPLGLGGTHLAELPLAPLSFRHIARAGASGEVSGHHHPKATLRAGGRTVSRPCFLYDGDRVILPAFGTYTGGQRSTAPDLAHLMRREALAVLIGRKVQVIPMPGRAG